MVLLQLTGHDWDLNLRATNHPEFDAWRWNDYWVPLDVVVEFKRGVYEMALTELSRYVPRNDPRNRYLRSNARLRDGEPHEGEMMATETLQVSVTTVVSYHSPLRMMQDMELPPGASFDPDPGNAGHEPGRSNG